MLPFEIEWGNLDLSISHIYKDYPKEFIPSVFRQPSGIKAKKLDIEVIDETLYDPPAHMIAFRIPRSRLEGWIRALGILYYEHYGDHTNIYHVDWYDEPSQWSSSDHSDVSRSICIGLVKDTKLLFKLKLFITTGVIQVQGLQKDLFIKNDFPTLVSLVDALVRKTSLALPTSPHIEALEMLTPF
jgi:hypothetical protein